MVVVFDGTDQKPADRSHCWRLYEHAIAEGLRASYTEGVGTRLGPLRYFGALCQIDGGRVREAISDVLPLPASEPIAALGFSNGGNLAARFAHELYRQTGRRVAFLGMWDPVHMNVGRLFTRPLLPRKWWDKPVARPPADHVYVAYAGRLRSIWFAPTRYEGDDIVRQTYAEYVHGDVGRERAEPYRFMEYGLMLHGVLRTRLGEEAFAA